MKNWSISIVLIMISAVITLFTNIWLLLFFIPVLTKVLKK